VKTEASIQSATKELANQASAEQPVVPAELVEQAAEGVETLHA